MTTGLAGGIVLANDESVISSASLRSSNILMWIKMRLVLTNRRLAGDQPNFFMGIVPVGSQHITYPLGNIAGVSINTKFSILGIILGVIFVLIGITDIKAILSLVLGVLLIVNSFYGELRITNSGGQTLGHRISILDKGAAVAFVQEVNTAIANRG